MSLQWMVNNLWKFRWHFTFIHYHLYQDQKKKKYMLYAERMYCSKKDNKKVKMKMKIEQKLRRKSLFVWVFLKQKRLKNPTWDWILYKCNHFQNAQRLLFEFFKIFLQCWNLPTRSTILALFRWTILITEWYSTYWPEHIDTHTHNKKKTFNAFDFYTRLFEVYLLQMQLFIHNFVCNVI